MKKIYTMLTAAVCAATTLFSSSLSAQEACPAGVQKVFNFVSVNASNQLIHAVYIENFIPNAPITLFNGAALVTFGPVTDGAGNGAISYDPASPITDVSACNIPGCCRKPVPAIIDCTPTVLNVQYVAQGICAIYLNNSAANGEVRVFDKDLNLIPTASSNLAFTDITGFTCYIYPCDRVPVSIVACGATGCCSALIPAQAALPIKLTGFAARLNASDKADLFWTSHLEIGSDRFVIEKSVNGKDFSGIATVKTAGNTTAARSYNYTDNAFSTTAYYRLKMVDIDGKSDYSKVVYVNNKNSSGKITSVFPNPFKSDIQIVGINSSDLNSNNVKIFNSTGQRIGYKITGANAITLDESAPTGLYILNVKDQKIKLIKQ